MECKFYPLKCNLMGNVRLRMFRLLLFKSAALIITGFFQHEGSAVSLFFCSASPLLTRRHPESPSQHCWTRHHQGLVSEPTFSHPLKATQTRNEMSIISFTRTWQNPESNDFARARGELDSRKYFSLFFLCLLGVASIRPTRTESLPGSDSLPSLSVNVGNKYWVVLSFVFFFFARIHKHAEKQETFS